MGVGKSTVGQLLADLLGKRFFDSDDEIESQAGRSIAQIFETEGEAGFRRMEAEVIDALCVEDSVIALGGGALTTPGTLEKLLDRGDLVYLEASVDALIGRIRDPSSRPILAGLDESAQRAKLEALFLARRPLYEKATFIVEAEAEPQEVASRIKKILTDATNNDAEARRNIRSADRKDGDP